MKRDKTKLFRYGLLAISVLFYMFWFFWDGIRIEADTNGYVNFSMSREPLYPIFLAVCRGIFGQQYFTWVGVIQSLFWAYVVWYLSDTLYREMKLGRFSYIVMLGICFLTCLMTRFLAGRQAMYSLDIASEGISIPLFLLFVTELFVYMSRNQKRHLAGIVILGILLISVRKQMYIVVLIMGAVFGVWWLLKQIKFKRLLMLWGLTIATFVGAVLLDMGYNLVLRGEAVRHSTDSSALLINAVFVATESDAENIEDESVQQLFLDIIAAKKEKNWGYEASPEGLRELSAHYAANFDNIAFGIVNPSFYDFLEEQGIEGYVELELAFGQLNDYMFSSVFKSNIPKMLHVFFANVITGVCNTVAKDSNILIPFVIMVYALFAVELAFLGIKEKLVPEVKLAMITMVCMVVNIVAVSAMIFSQSRYMIYNMPLFYCSLYVMFRKIIEMIMVKKRKKNGQDCSVNSMLQ